MICLLPLRAVAGTIVVVGDSLSAAYGMRIESGWVALLQKRLRDEKLPYDVVNASISGDTTASGRARLPRLLAQHKPEIVILQLGGNDGLRALSPAEMRANLRSMAQQARTAGARVLLLGVELPPNYGRRYTERFRRVYDEVAREAGIPLAPFLLDGIATHPELMQADGIHPNGQAQARMLANVWPHLRPLL